MREWKKSFPKTSVPGGHNSNKAILARTINQGIFVASGSKGNIQNWRYRVAYALAQQDNGLDAGEKLEIQNILLLVGRISEDLRLVEQFIRSHNERKKGKNDGQSTS